MDLHCEGSNATQETASFYWWNLASNEGLLSCQVTGHVKIPCDKFRRHRSIQREPVSCEHEDRHAQINTYSTILADELSGVQNTWWCAVPIDFLDECAWNEWATVVKCPAVSVYDTLVCSNLAVERAALLFAGEITDSILCPKTSNYGWMLSWFFSDTPNKYQYNSSTWNHAAIAFFHILLI